jgi:hypothetical protein
LLSLDAPLVAVLWQVLFVRCFRAQPGIVAPTLLASAVWLIYSADRMLDAWRGIDNRPRHEFYKHYWRLLLPAWGSVFVLTGLLSWIALPWGLFARGVGLIGAVAVYFAVVHAAPERIRRYWPKEAMVGVLFALGASVAAWNQVRSVADILTLLLFSCLCWINCAAIEQWESGRGRWPVGAISGGIALAALILLHQHRPVLGGAESASALAFVWLDRGRPKLSLDMLRVLADVALLSPIVFLPATWILA